MAAHTPAPWELHETEDGIEIHMGSRIGAFNHWQVQHAIEWGLSLDPEDDAEQYGEALANARLMAAAPDLLAAIEGHVCGYCQNRVGFDPDPSTSPYPKPCQAGGCVRLRAAIAKARGDND